MNHVSFVLLAKDYPFFRLSLYSGDCFLYTSKGFYVYLTPFFSSWDYFLCYCIPLQKDLTNASILRFRPSLSLVPALPHLLCSAWLLFLDSPFFLYNFHVCEFQIFSSLPFFGWKLPICSDSPDNLGLIKIASTMLTVLEVDPRNIKRK